MLNEKYLIVSEIVNPDKKNIFWGNIVFVVFQKKQKQKHHKFISCFQ